MSCGNVFIKIEVILNIDRSLKKLKKCRMETNDVSKTVHKRDVLSLQLLSWLRASLFLKGFFQNFCS